MLDDKDLVRRLSAGDTGALVGIYTKYKDDLLTVACCLLGRTAGAEDVLHDVFVTFADGAAATRLRGNLRSYLVASVVNRARDHLRQRRRDPARLELTEDLIAGEDSPVAQASHSEEARRLFANLAKLPYEQREVITLHLHGGLRFREIARQQGLSINTVQSRYRYGLDKLRSVLGVGVNT